MTNFSNPAFWNNFKECFIKKLECEKSNNSDIEILNKYIYNHESDWNYMFEDFKSVSNIIGYFAVINIRCLDITKLSVTISAYDDKGNPYGEIDNIEI